MTIQERLKNVEENFNELKEMFTQKESEVNKLQSEMSDIEKQLIFMRGAHQALSELLEDEKEETSEKVEAEIVE